MKKTIRNIVLILSFTTTCYSQSNDTIHKAYYGTQNEEISFKYLTKLTNLKMLDYQGSYHFGESEGESQLEILYSNDKLFAREEYSNWKNDTWELVYDRKKPEFNNGILLVDDISYDLYAYGMTKGLGSSYTDVDEEKVYQYLQYNVDTFIKIPLGKHPETSFVKLSKKDLESYTKSELKIMRNEIFARKGYSFKAGGEMDLYFSQQDWYNSLEKKKDINVDDIEKHNIDLILKLEK